MSGATGQPLASTQKQLISRLSATLEQKVITINERGLTSTQWTVYNEGTKRTTHSTVPTSDTTAETVAVDGFATRRKGNTGISTTAARHYSAEGISLTQTNGRGNATATETDKAGRTARKGATVNDTFAYNTRSELTEATTYTYTPYGEVTTSGNTVQPLQWSSEYSDAEPGIVYYNYRFYNSLISNWLNRDYISERQNRNSYNAFLNAPISQVSPWVLGLELALLALVAGQAGSQALAPEEIVTVPGAFVAGVLMAL